MSLPWVRLESNIGTHDKILHLLSMKDGAKAFVLYVSALGYAGGHATDGKIERCVLTVNHGTPRLAQLLVEARLWEYHAEGGGHYQIRNWAQRQELAAVTALKQAAGSRAACIRWHGKGCGCWDAKPPP